MPAAGTLDVSRGDEREPDLRYTQREQERLRIERELDGGGRLARGAGTGMHTLRFSQGAQPRSERDPHHVARRPEVPARAPDDVMPAIAEGGETVVNESMVPAPVASRPRSIVDVIRRLFGMSR